MLINSTVLVTGAYGFLGQYLVEYLRNKRVNVITFPHIHGLSLEDYKQVESFFYKTKPNYVFHLAGFNGGIQFNLDYPADIFHRNTVMGLNVLRACMEIEVEKVVSVVASCGYPDVPVLNENMTEETYLSGLPNDTVACHGYAKRNLVLASKFYNKQYGLNAVTVCPTTLYGPGDNFDVYRTKVMGGLIKRFLEAEKDKKDEVQCWGTGNALREFMYVTDATWYICAAMNSYNDSTIPINIGSGQEVTIKDLARKVADAVKYTGSITWDTSKPDGQNRKRLSRKRQLDILGEIEMTKLEDGIQATVDWCRQARIV